jgi:hypothetical protein
VTCAGIETSRSIPASFPCPVAPVAVRGTGRWLGSGLVRQGSKEIRAAREQLAKLIVGRPNEPRGTAAGRVCENQLVLRRLLFGCPHWVIWRCFRRIT